MMTRLFKLFGVRRSGRHLSLVDAPDSESGLGAGWHESSMELRRGLTVLEEEELDCGPETRPFTYQVEAA